MKYKRMQHSLSLIITFGLLVLLILFANFLESVTVVYAQNQEKIIAEVNGRKVTQSEIDQSIAGQIIPLQQQIYALRKVALENLILRIILEDEAKKRGISVEALKKELIAAKVEVKQSDVERLYAETHQALGFMSEDEAKERLRLDLETQARMKNYRSELSKLKQSYHIEWNLEEPTLLTANVDNPNIPSLGRKDAPVTIVEFSDFQCPFCRGSQSTIKKILQTYGNNVRLVFRNLPLEMHPQAFSSAKAAFCGGEQNHFWQYHDALFAADDLSPEAFTKIAVSLGLDIPRFKKCFDSESAQVAVRRDVEEAKRLGITATPTFIINGTPARGAIDFEEFSSIITRKLNNSQTNIQQR